MATTTTNLALTKPDLTDARDIRVLNANFNILDTAITGNSNGQLKVWQAGTPTIAAGAALGTTPTVTITGNDSRGILSLTAGTTPTTGILCTVTFKTSFSAAPAAVVLEPATNPGAAFGHVSSTYISSITTTTFVFSCGVAPTASTNYQFYYIVVA